MKAKRFNKGKLPWMDYPLFLFRPVIEVAKMGTEKYGQYNFMDGGDQNQYLNSALRHIDSYIDPAQSDNDKESGINHLAHACWNLLMAIYMLKKRPDLDNRPKEGK